MRFSADIREWLANSGERQVRKDDGMEKEAVLGSRISRGLGLETALAAAVVLSLVTATTVFVQDERTVYGCYVKQHL